MFYSNESVHSVFLISARIKFKFFQNAPKIIVHEGLKKTDIQLYINEFLEKKKKKINNNNNLRIKGFFDKKWIFLQKMKF